MWPTLPRRRSRPSLQRRTDTRRDGRRRNEKSPRRLSQRPAPCGAQFQDCEPFDRRVVRPALSGEQLPAGIFDAEFLLEQRDLLLEAFVLGLESDARVEVMLGPTLRDGERGAGHRHGVDDRRAHAAGPALRKGYRSVLGFRDDRQLPRVESVGVRSCTREDAGKGPRSPVRDDGARLGGDGERRSLDSRCRERNPLRKDHGTTKR